MSSLLRRSLPSLLLISSATGCTVFDKPIVAEDAGNSVPSNVTTPDEADASMMGSGPDAEVAPTDDAAADASEDDAQMSQVTDDSGVGADAALQSEVDAGNDAAVGTPSCVVAGADPMEVCAGPIVINETDGSGGDFVEIYNRGDVDVNIGGWMIADDSGGSPAVAEGAAFPIGTVLGAHRFLYVWSNLAAEPDGSSGKLYDACLPNTPAPCLHSTWGISAGGERLYLINANLEVVCAANYPTGVLGPEAFGRIPDGSDMWCPTAPTAGSPNARSTSR